MNRIKKIGDGHYGHETANFRMNETRKIGKLLNNVPKCLKTSLVAEG